MLALPLEALQDQANQGQLLFHGSPFLVTQLEPRQAFSNRQPDGPPAVAATIHLHQAIFRSLIHSSRDQHHHRQHHSAWIVNNNQVTYFSLCHSYDNLTDQDPGYIYIFQTANHHFHPYRGEFRSPQAVTPDQIITVHKPDLPPIHLFDTIAQLQAAQQVLKETGSLNLTSNH